MREKDLRVWLREEDAPDSWWVSVDGVRSEKPLPLSDAFKQPGVQPGCELSVLHVSKIGLKDEPWVDLDINSALPETKRLKIIRKKRRPKRRIIPQLAIILLIFLSIVLFVPRDGETLKEPTIEDPIERIMAKLDEVQTTRSRDGSGTLPSLRASVSTTGRLLFIANLSEQIWPSCEVTINGPDGYSHSWSEPIESLKTLYAPLRSFTSADGQPFNQESTPLRRISIVVPGFRKWEENIR